MLKKASLLVVGVSICALSAGCGQEVTAAGIAESYGILNRCDLQKSIAELIQNGQADYMIDAGHCRTRNFVKNIGTAFGKRRVFVTEYLIHGEVYRVEVRRPIDPMRNLSKWDLQVATFAQFPDQEQYRWFDLTKIHKTLRKHSYEGRPEVAYRAWRDLEGKVHDVRLLRGQEPDWTPTDKSIQLTIRTKQGQISAMRFRGLTSDGRHEDAHKGPHPLSKDGPYIDLVNGKLKAPFGHVSQWRHSHDYRWIMEARGPGTQCPPFINLKLYGVLRKNDPIEHFEDES